MKDEPKIISSGLPHEVHLPEGSHTAVSKTASAMEPQIRKTAASHDFSVEVMEVVKGLTHQQIEEERLAQVAQAGSKIEKASTAHRAEDTMASERLAHAQGSEPQDRFAQAPDGNDAAARIANAEGAAEEDRIVQAVEAAEQAEHLVSEDSAASAHAAPGTALPLDQLMADLPSLDLPASEAALPMTTEGSPSSPKVRPEPALAPAPTAQVAAAQADSSNVAVEIATVQQQMADMNFPARVVKLKIANDQMRGQIEKLEKPLFAPIPVEVPAPAKAKGKEKEAAKKPAKGH